jgi:periplasmic divalent cation tolerance protein
MKAFWSYGGKAIFFFFADVVELMSQGYSMIYVTVKEMSEASKIARHLVERRLIACANMFPIRSVYPWWGKVEEGEEVAMIMKTRSSLVDEVIKEVRKVHTYEVPCIVSYKMEKGLQGYLDWIESETGPKVEVTAKKK